MVPVRAGLAWVSSDNWVGLKDAWLNGEVPQQAGCYRFWVIARRCAQVNNRPWVGGYEVVGPSGLHPQGANDGYIMILSI